MEACRNKLRVGIVWRGRETHSDDSNRSCPLSCFVDLAGQLDISLFSLQKGPSSLAGTETPADFPIIDISRYSDDFYDTAAATGRLDLIITVDTSVAHLAGASVVQCGCFCHICQIGGGCWIAKTRLGIRACACSGKNRPATGMVYSSE